MTFTSGTAGSFIKIRVIDDNTVEQPIRMQMEDGAQLFCQLSR